MGQRDKWDRETEERDCGTVRQWDRETAGQRDSGTERQWDSETEGQWNRDRAEW